LTSIFFFEEELTSIFEYVYKKYILFTLNIWKISEDFLLKMPASIDLILSILCLLKHKNQVAQGRDDVFFKSSK
jgi:hypothetical protein